MQVPGSCHSDPSCYSHLLGSGQLQVVASAEEAASRVMANPRQIDAVVIVSAAPSASPSYSTASWSYIIRMNHTDVPPTPLLLDLFDVSPTPTNGLGYYRDYWFFANLQVRWDFTRTGHDTITC